MHVAPHMFKTITVKANAMDIITWKCIWHQICTKSLLWRQMLRKSLLKNAFGTTYVQNCYFEGNCWGNRYFKMCLTPNMYKIVSLKTNAKEIVTWKWFWCQICTKSLLCRQMLISCTTLKDQQRGLDMERCFDPRRNSTYERPFTWEGNYLVFRVNLGMWPLKSIVLEKQALFWGF